MAANDETQPISYVTCPQDGQPLVVLSTPYQTAGRHRAPRRSRRPSRALSWASVAYVWSVVWPPLVGIVAGTVLAVSIALALVTAWWYSL